MECRNTKKLTRSFLRRKEEVISNLYEIERMLVLIDKKMYYDRVNIVKLLQYVGGGIEGREENIKNLLADIAKLEMQKSEQEDRLSEQTLKTIEIVNIADIKEEMLSLEKSIDVLQLRKNELD